MIRVVFYKDSKDEYIGFSLSGHAGYAKAGQDIVCAAVSALCLNTVNSVEAFTKDLIRLKTDEAAGVLKLRFVNTVSPESKLLTDALKLGREGIRDNNNFRYLSVTTKRRCKS